nr:hypothetical protein HmN_000127000 [Hymenolepis microstoma]
MIRSRCSCFSYTFSTITFGVNRQDLSTLQKSAQLSNSEANSIIVRHNGFPLQLSKYPILISKLPTQFFIDLLPLQSPSSTPPYLLSNFGITTSNATLPDSGFHHTSTSRSPTPRSSLDQQQLNYLPLVCSLSRSVELCQRKCPKQIIRHIPHFVIQRHTFITISNTKSCSF